MIELVFLGVRAALTVEAIRIMERKRPDAGFWRTLYCVMVPLVAAAHYHCVKVAK